MTRAKKKWVMYGWIGKNMFHPNLDDIYAKRWAYEYTDEWPPRRVRVTVEEV